MRDARICFFFNAQRHQLLHGLSTAVELARLGGVEVHVVSPSRGHVAYAREVVDRLGGAPIVFTVAGSRILAGLARLSASAVPPKAVSLGLLARHLNGYDAIAVPERTSILLKRLGASRPRYIHLDHGAGDRAAGFDPRIREFDMVLLPGDKHRDRMLREGLIWPGRYAVVGYPKFEAADAVRDATWRPFDNDRPTVLYNPHFSDLGSWAAFGEAVLGAFAEQDRYNLILAPHVRMLDGKAARWRTLIETYGDRPHIHIDTGSERSIDMTYTTVADVYLGDVSSQVYEFLREPRPCVFLDSQGVDWRQDENYAHWRFGPVARTPDRVLPAIVEAIAGHASFRDIQTEGFERTFASGSGSASVRAAQALRAFLGEHRGKAAPPRAPRQSTLRYGLRAATLAAAVGAGWVGHAVMDVVERRGDPVFVADAVTSHRMTKVRAAMRSQPGVRTLDRAEIRDATGIEVPQLPDRWTVADVQIYPSERGPIVQVAAVTETGEPISFVAMRIDTPSRGRLLLEEHRGDRVAYWEESDQAYGLVGALPAQVLLTLAAEVAGPAKSDRTATDGV
jgi:hypothetical protein